jgi:hypothetical protein
MMDEKTRQAFEQLIVDNNLVMTTLLKDLVEDAHERTVTEISSLSSSPLDIKGYFVGYSACLFDCIKYIDYDKVGLETTEQAKLLSKVMLQFFTLAVMTEQARKRGVIPESDSTDFDAADLFGDNYLELDDEED